MPVYLARSGADGAVKIGLTSIAAARGRFVKLQVDNAHPIKLVRFLDGGRKLEAELHTRFASLRLNGEWFTYTDAMLGDLGASDIPFPEPPQRDPCAWTWSPEARADQSVRVRARHADPVFREKYLNKLRATLAKRIQISRIDDLIRRAGSVYKFAEIAGVPQVELHRWSAIPADKAPIIAEGLNLPVWTFAHLIAEPAA
jgi:Meiotically up-regulated gene 113